MKCPRCGENNNDELQVCSNCKLKLMSACPKCNSLNRIGTEKCISCDNRLILYCPQCKTINHPDAPTCRRCSYSLQPKSRVSKQENAILQQEANSGEQEITIKDDVQLGNIVLAVEMFNYSELKARTKPELLDKILKSFYSVIIQEAKNKGEKAVKLSDSVVKIEFKLTDTQKLAATSSVIAAQNIISKLSELNEKLEKSFKFRINLKTGISYLIPESESADIERAFGQLNQITISETVAKLVEDMFDFQQLNTGSRKNIVLYTLTGEKNTDLNPEKPEDRVEVQEEKTETPIKVPLRNYDNTSVNSENNSVENKTSKNISQTAVEKNFSKEEAYHAIYDIVGKEKKGYIFAVTGPEGIGKSTMVSSVRQSLASDKIIWITGLCQPVHKLAPFGFLQDIFKTLLNIPPVICDLNDAKKAITTFIESIGLKDTHAETDLNRLILYDPMAEDISELFVNKKALYNSLREIIKALSSKGTIVLFIDDIEFIDSASLKWLKKVVEDLFLNLGNHIIAVHSPEQNFDDYFYLPSYGKRITKIRIKPMTLEQMNKALLGMLNAQEVLPSELKTKIFEQSKGFPLYIEQVLWLLFQLRAVYSENNILKFNPQAENIEISENLDEIIALRVSQIININETILGFFNLAGILGQRFMPAIIQEMLGINKNNFDELMHLLTANGFIVPFDNDSSMFKHKKLWDLIYFHLVPAEQKASYHKIVLETLDKLYLSASIPAISAEISGQNEAALELWMKSSMEAVTVGDPFAYSFCQKQVLNLLGKTKSLSKSNREQLKYAICEKLGRINYEINPEEAVKYLSEAIIGREKKNETIQLIDLTGYLSRSCELLNNYSGVIECVDRALSHVDKEMFPVESALLSYSKLDAMYNLGKLEELGYTASQQVIPVIKNAIVSNTSFPNLTMQELINIELDAELLMAKAMALQGNKEVMNIVNPVVSTAKEQGLTDIEAKARLIEALYKILQGRIKPASNVLAYVRDILPKVKNNKRSKLYWNFLNMLSVFMSESYNQAGKLCHPLLREAEANKEYTLVVIIKLIMAKLLRISGKIDKSKTILNELVMYSSEYKLATSALVGWYFIAETEFFCENLQAGADIAVKALEIAQKSNINNYFISVMLMQLLAEIKIKTSDYDTAAIYLEKALNTAKNMDLFLCQATLNLTYGKIYEDVAVKVEKDRNIYVDNAYKSYNIALEIAQTIENDNLSVDIRNRIEGLKTKYQLSNA